MMLSKIGCDVFTLVRLKIIKQYFAILACCFSLVACNNSTIGMDMMVQTVNSAPTASDVIILHVNGVPAVVGDIMEGNYTYADSEGDVEGGSTFRWLRNGVVIIGEAASVYTLVSADVGKTIAFEVEPVAVTGKIMGQAVRSMPISIVNGVTNQIEQFGIRWEFDHNYVYDLTYGQFANGDYWIVGPVTITNITPNSIVDATGRTLNGSMINPSPRDGVTQGYDSAMYGIYDSSFDSDLNVARPNLQNISSYNPLVVAINSSLVSTVSAPLPRARPQLVTAAILTVVPYAPPEGSFRPPYSGGRKVIKFNKSELNYSLLGRLMPVASVPSMAKVERYFERPWIDNVPGWRGGYVHPSSNMPHYGREISSQVGVGALMLHLNFRKTAKEKLLVRYVQLGLDLYGVVQDGGGNNWLPDGGHASGRKWPIIFAGLMLNDTAMKNIGPGDGTGTVQFGEDGQTFYVTQADIDLVHTPDLRKGSAVQYTQADLDLAEWGINHSYRPVKDNKNWLATYRNCCTANAWAGEILSARIMHAQSLWADRALFDYQDRYMNASPRGTVQRSVNSFSADMWDKYRSSY